MIDLRGVHTLVFDLDDTLYLERDYVLSGFSAVGAWLSATHGVEGFFGCATRLFENGLRGRVFDEALQQMGLPPTPGLIADMLALYRGHTPKLTPLADASACLGWAKSCMRTALLTDGYHAVQVKKVASLGIADRFDCVIYTDALGRESWKPSPAGFVRIMEALPGQANGFVYVADNPRKDFIGPRSLGWRTVRIRRKGGEHAAYDGPQAESADIEITSLDALGAPATRQQPR